MRTTSLGADKALRSFQNVYFDVATLRGQPVCLKGSGTQDGVLVTLPASADAARAHTLLFGIAMQDVAAGGIGQVCIQGLCETALTLRQTRAASTDSYASASSLPNAGALQVQTALNCVTNTGTVGASNVLPAMALIGSYASAASLASSDVTGPASTATAISTYVKAFLRLM